MKVLIVDDEQLICESLKADLARMDHPWKYEVFTARSVAAAEEIYYREEPRILITDINMPKGSGLILVSEIHKHNPACKILVVSAYDDFDYVRNAFVMGANDYILKPVAFSELENHMRRLAELVNAESVVQEEQVNIFKMEDVLDYVRQHIGERLNAAEMAKKMAVSYGNFGRLFREHTGMSFHGYVLWYRMERAKEYLENPHIKIKQVASKVGYRDNPQHFSRDFTRQVGIAPKEYRAQITGAADDTEKSDHAKIPGEKEK